MKLTFSWENYTMKALSKRKRGKNMKKKAPGRTLLLVTGIICVVLAVIQIASGAINLSTASQMENGTLDAATQQIFDSVGMTAEVLRATVRTAVINGVLLLAAGICGIVFGNKVKKYRICFVFGIVMIAYYLIAAGISAAMNGFSVLSIIDIVISLIVPILYFWGAVKNRQAVQEEAGN